jgi:AraC-like DNA-binding protein
MRQFVTRADRIVPTHHPWVLLETARARGVTIEALLAGTELSPEVFEIPEARISYDEYGILIRNALRLTGDSGLGSEVGKHLGAGQMGVLGLALMTSRTVGEAFDLWLQYAPALAPSWELSLSAEPPEATLVAREAMSHRPFEVYATELLLSATLTIGRQLLGADLPVRRVQLAYSRPPHADRCPEVYARAVEFDQDVTRMAFDAAMLDATIPFADPATAKLARRYCAEQLPLDPALEALVPKVRRILANAVGKPPNLLQLARTLQTSPRTLRRIFDQMGTSYRELLDESRRTRAVEWTRSASLSVGTIAERLGFRDVRSFRRAFKRWTGHPPGALRQRRA